MVKMSRLRILKTERTKMSFSVLRIVKVVNTLALKDMINILMRESHIEVLLKLRYLHVLGWNTISYPMLERHSFDVVWYHFQSHYKPEQAKGEPAKSEGMGCTLTTSPMFQLVQFTCELSETQDQILDTSVSDKFCLHIVESRSMG